MQTPSVNQLLQATSCMDNGRRRVGFTYVVILVCNFCLNKHLKYYLLLS